MFVSSLNLKRFAFFVLGFVTLMCSVLPVKSAVAVDPNAVGKSATIQQQLDDLVLKLKVYTVYDQSGQIQLVRHGRAGDGGYFVPRVAFEKADILLGYGIADDISFEEMFSTLYQKPSYGFDCGVPSIPVTNKLCTFVSECIAHDSNLYAQQKSSGRFSTFPDQLKRIQAGHKKLFIKMDIEGAEYAAFEGIKSYFSNITGIVLEIHFVDDSQVSLANILLDVLLKDFYLVHLHANNCSPGMFQAKHLNGNMPRVVELTFINKNLVTHAALSPNQNYPLPGDMENCPTFPPAKFQIVQ